MDNANTVITNIMSEIFIQQYFSGTLFYVWGHGRFDQELHYLNTVNRKNTYIYMHRVFTHVQFVLLGGMDVSIKNDTI